MASANSALPQISDLDHNLVRDGSLDYMGRIADKLKTGSWKSCWPVLAYIVPDTVIFLSISGNIITYMTGVLHRKISTSASDVNNMQGTAFVTSLIGGFISDTYLGRYKTISLAFQVYFSGLIFLTISVSLKSLRPLPCQNGACPPASSLQLGIFFLGLYLFALGFGSLKSCMISFGADQFEEEDLIEKRGMASFFNWTFWFVNLGGIFAVTAIVYIQDTVSWGWGIGILLFFLAVAEFLFFAMTKHYRYSKSQGSPLAQIADVLITTFQRRKLKTTDNFHEDQNISYGKRLLVHTNQFRFLDKAAMKQEEEIGSSKPCTLTQVEEVKLVLRIIPIWIVVLWLGIVPSQVGTFFVTQGNFMDRQLGSFTIPPASMFAFTFLVPLMFIPIYDKLVVPFVRNYTKNERGFSMLQRLGIAYVICVLNLVVAAVVEMKRKRSSGKLSVFWLVPQYGMLGLYESFSNPALQEFFDEQLPDNMQSLGVSLAYTNLGVGYFLNSAIVNVVDRANPSWLQNDINKGHIDLFYWVLAVATAVNLLLFLQLAWSYSYKRITKSPHVTIEMAK